MEDMKRSDEIPRLVTIEGLADAATGKLHRRAGKRSTNPPISEGMGARGASDVDDFGFRGINTPHVMPHTQNS